MGSPEPGGSDRRAPATPGESPPASRRPAQRAPRGPPCRRPHPAAFPSLARGPPLLACLIAEFEERYGGRRRQAGAAASRASPAAGAGRSAAVR